VSSRHSSSSHAALLCWESRSLVPYGLGDVSIRHSKTSLVLTSSTPMTCRCQGWRSSSSQNRTAHRLNYGPTDHAYSS
jgi:hypothetical protein